MKSALISVYDKTDLSILAQHLFNQDYQIISTGGTYQSLLNTFPERTTQLLEVSTLTHFPEILDGRVKTLHPLIYASLLARRDKPEHLTQLQTLNCPDIQLVAVNLYPFHQAVEQQLPLEATQELIDIGGVSLLRAAAKNPQHIVVLSHPSQYQTFIKQPATTLPDRLQLACQAYQITSHYDATIMEYLSQGQKTARFYQQELPLRYGCNPHQTPARFMTIWNPRSLHKALKTPFQILNSSPSYINLLDALNSWQLVKEAQQALQLPIAASFKHTSPAGVAAGNLPLHPTLQQAYGIKPNSSLLSSPIAVAYLKARNSDPMSSFGDFIALSDTCDLPTALLIQREVSDGIIAPAYTPEALEILKNKKSGSYLILQSNPLYENTQLQEYRELYGVVLAQPPNTATFSHTSLFLDTSSSSDTTSSSDTASSSDTSSNSSSDTTVSTSPSIPHQNQQDLLLANITIKYTQSNSVAMSLNGQVVAIAGGQQSRIDCVKLCAKKLKTWYLRQHPKALNLLNQFRSDVPIKRPNKINAIVAYLEDESDTQRLFLQEPRKLTTNEKTEWLQTLTNVSLASDAFFPFRDSIDQAAIVGVKYIIQPGGSQADAEIQTACEQYQIQMIQTNVRLFTH